MESGKGMNRTSIGYASFMSSMPPSSKVSQVTTIVPGEQMPPQYEEGFTTVDMREHRGPVEYNAAVAPIEEVDEKEPFATSPVVYSHEKSKLVRKLLWISLALLMVSSAMQMAFSASVIDWLITVTATRRKYTISTNDPQDGSGLQVMAQPWGLNRNPMYVAISAGSIAFILVGIWGLIAIPLRGRAGFSTSAWPKVWYQLWMCWLVSSVILSVSTLVYVFIEQAKHASSTITYADIRRANQINQDGGYPYNDWDPSTWFSALDRFPIFDAYQSQDVKMHLQLILGYMFNLVPLSILGLSTLYFAVMDGILRRRTARALEEKEAVFEE